jgi:predicted component of type VI protein secretion system
VAESVYVVFTDGETAREPEEETVPMPLSIETEVASAVVHESVVVCPAGIDCEDAESVQVGAGVCTGAPLPFFATI